MSKSPKPDPWLITRLFDLGFSRFVALSLVRIVYVLLMIAGLVVLAFAVTFLFRVGQHETTLAAILVLVLAPLIFFAYLLVIRVICETLIVVFAMAEDLDEIRAALRDRADRGSSTPAESKSGWGGGNSP